jgi:hypothetical protein
MKAHIKITEKGKIGWKQVSKAHEKKRCKTPKKGKNGEQKITSKGQDRWMKTNVRRSKEK